jgi:hypothetical protein
MIVLDLHFGDGGQFETGRVRVRVNDLEAGFVSPELVADGEGKKGRFVLGKKVFLSFLELPVGSFGEFFEAFVQQLLPAEGSDVVGGDVVVHKM